MTVVTRFAPSPTGYLHIGGARTALFNWLYARRHQGRFLLRIEDTDRARSTDDAIRAILDGMAWLGLDWDGDAQSQFERRDRHSAAAHRLLEEGNAYHCYCTPDELAEMRETARREGRSPRYDGRWRDRDPAEAPPGVPPVVRFKAPQEGSTTIADAVQGEVTVPNAQLDDMVLLRADSTPTYMLSVVVDDIEMGITHIIRGDDHLTNAFRQFQLYQALEAGAPTFAHIPLIHGPDGAKLSKRHGSLGLEAYRDLGYLPAALRNYLLRLGWAHGDDEVISTEQAVAWFDLPAIGKGAARFDTAKLDNLNGLYLRQTGDAELAALAEPRISAIVGRPLADADRQRLRAGMAGLKQRAKTLRELAESAAFYAKGRPLDLTEKAAGVLNDAARGMLAGLGDSLAGLAAWDEAAVEETVRRFAERQGMKLGQVAQPLRAALTGSTISPGVFEVAAILGRDEALARIDDAVGGVP
ncbi:MAG: glutamate--tRNA ligase [Inquilinus sp.]|nr:glutamate--tRNA ligase [Inquilinus sp.]